MGGLADIELTEEDMAPINKSIEEVMKTDIVSIVKKMESAEIKTDEDFMEASGWLKGNKGLQKKVKDHFEPERKATHEAYKGITGKIKKYTDILIKGEGIVKKKLADYQKELDRKRKIEEARIEKEQEEKRLKLENEAKLKREKLEKEARLKREKLEEDARIKREAEAEEKNVPVEDIPVEEIPEVEVVDVVEEEYSLDIFDVDVPAVPVAKKIDTKGVIFVDVWKWELEDISKVPAEYLMVDTKKINGVVRSMKGDTKIPGIKIIKDKQVRA